MANGAATGTLVCTSICYRMISSIYVRASHHLVRDLIVTTGCPVDVAISMVVVSIGQKELTGVSGRVWLESDHSIDMIFWFLLLVQGE